MTQTAQDIMEVLEGYAANKVPVDPTAYLEASQKLTSLLGNESDLLYTMEQRVAQMRVELLEKGMKSVEVKIRVEASDEYRLARNQKAMIDRMVETVRLAKLRARLAQEEYRSQMS